jgi:hypothetical protein
MRGQEATHPWRLAGHGSGSTRLARLTAQGERRDLSGARRRTAGGFERKPRGVAAQRSPAKLSHTLRRANDDQEGHLGRHRPGRDRRCPRHGQLEGQ